ncbi:MAG TPA: glycine zipper domain-containing protein [Pseudolabrys sp.]|jgi:surface antigen|nr:glycine zipper domain-containing protein [Pseudolabrys sp.]
MTIRRGALCAMFGVVLIGSLAGCAGDPTGEYGPGPKENTGTLLGALGGAVIGSQFGGGAGGHVAGAVIGAAAGGLIGNRIGASLDEEDRRRAYAAEVQALEGGAAGAPVGWRSERSGRYGSVVPGPYYVDNGRRCRAFTETIYIDGRPQTARGTACRNPDGTWTPVG